MKGEEMKRKETRGEMETRQYGAIVKLKGKEERRGKGRKEEMRGGITGSMGPL